MPYVWLGLFLQYRIVPDVDRKVFRNVRKLLASVGEHFLASASASLLPNTSCHRKGLRVRQPRDRQVSAYQR